jgi:hypothetical protein
MQYLYPAVLNLAVFGFPLALTWGRHIHQPVAVGLGVGFLANVLGSAAGAWAPDHEGSPPARIIRALTPAGDYRLK